MKNRKLIFSAFLGLFSFFVYAQFPMLESGIAVNIRSVNYVDGDKAGKGFEIANNMINRTFSGGGELYLDYEFNVRSALTINGFFQYEGLKNFAIDTDNFDNLQELDFDEQSITLFTTGGGIFYTYRFIYNPKIIEAISRNRGGREHFSWLSVTLGSRYNVFLNNNLLDTEFLDSDGNPFKGKEELNENSGAFGLVGRINWEYDYWPGKKAKIYLEYEYLVGDRFQVNSTSNNISFRNISLGVEWWVF